MEGHSQPDEITGHYHGGRMTMEGKRFIATPCGPIGPLFAALLAMQPSRTPQIPGSAARRTTTGSR